MSRIANIISISWICFQALCPLSRPSNPQQPLQFDPVVVIDLSNRTPSIISISWKLSVRCPGR